MSSAKEFNILLLGSTGVGKSTWINALANYLSFKSLEVAENHEMACVIPTYFKMIDDNFDQVEISMGNCDESKNEVLGSAESATQQAMSYIFRVKGQTIRIIDTPGIADTRGIGQDEKNFEFIMNHLSHLGEIHGILILIKPNEARLNIMFEFCIKELLTHLHKENVDNIAFCFTNARGTFYRPGDSYTLLKNMLTIDPNQDFNSSEVVPSIIPLNKQTVYCIDNEAVRFLAACKNGVQFSATEKLNYSESWVKGVEETGRLLKHFLTLKPDSTMLTLSLNTNRQILFKLVTVLTTVETTLRGQSIVIAEREKEIFLLEKRIAELHQKFDVKLLTLEKVQLENNTKKIVCTSPGCCETVEIFESDSKTSSSAVNYKQICHNNCNCCSSLLALSQLNNCFVQSCQCFDASVQFQCKICGCSWVNHMQINYEMKKIFLQGELPESVQSELSRCEENVREIKSILRNLKDERGQLEVEKKVVQEGINKFAMSVKKNALIPYNDSVVRYVDHLIAVVAERDKDETRSGDVSGQMVLAELKKIKSVQMTLIEIMKSVMEIKDEQVSSQNEKTDEVDNVNDSTKLMNEIMPGMYELQICGQQIQELFKHFEESEVEDGFELLKCGYKEKIHKFTRINSTYTKFMSPNEGIQETIFQGLSSLMASFNLGQRK